MPTGLRTDWANYIKNVQAEQQGVANWNSIFTSMLDTQYKIGSTELERASQKNIDSAYSNYLHNQMSLKYTDNLTEGYRQYAEDSIKNEYDAAIATEQQNLTANKATLYSELATNTAKLQQQQQEAIDEQALRMLEYENYMFKYISDGAMTNDNNETFLAQFPELFKYTTESGGDEDWEKESKAIGWSDEANKFLFEEKNGTKTWSDQGKQFLSVVLGSGFDDWLKNNVSTEKYSDWDENYRTLFNESVFGQSINPYQDTKADMAGIRESVRVDRLNTAMGNNSEGTAGDRYVTNNNGYSQLSKDDVNDIFSDPVKNGGGWMHAIVLNDYDKNFGKAKNANNALYYDSRRSDNDMSTAVNNYKYNQPGANKAYGKHITKISTELSSLKKSENLHKGDMFLVDDGNYIAYYSGNGYWRLAYKNELDEEQIKSLNKLGFNLELTDDQKTGN